MIYLDYAANTPVDPEVINVFVDACSKYIANPNSSHSLGRLARERIEEASSCIGNYFGCDSKNVIYTSGASESNNLVIKGVVDQSTKAKKKIIISGVEHSSVVAPCNYLMSKGVDVSVIPLTEEGVVDLECLEKEIDADTVLVSICAVDSELGTVQPIQSILDIVRKHDGVLFHTDATQAIGKVNLDYKGVDFITFAPHKFYGLNGFGALINMNDNKISPLVHGGKSTTIYRSGTPVTANVVALQEALAIATSKVDERYRYISDLNKMLRDAFLDVSSVHINSPEDAIPNTLNISLVGKDTKHILEELDKERIYLSTTTACSLGDTPSKSVLAVTNDLDLASNTIRISLSHLTKKEDILRFIEVFNKLISD